VGRCKDERECKMAQREGEPSEESVKV